MLARVAASGVDELWLLGTVPAGYPSPAQDFGAERIDLTRQLIKDPSATFLFRVVGDSMEGAGIYDGDVLLIDRSIEPSNSAVVLASIDGEYTVKRLHRGDGFVELRPENPRYPVIRVDGLSELMIFGVVTYSIHHV